MVHKLGAATIISDAPFLTMLHGSYHISFRARMCVRFSCIFQQVVGRNLDSFSSVRDAAFGRVGCMRIGGIVVQMTVEALHVLHLLRAQVKSYSNPCVRPKVQRSVWISLKSDSP